LHGDHYPFFGIVGTPLVRRGDDEKLVKDEKLDGGGGHTFRAVYTEMLYQVSRDYTGLPDVRTLKANEIRFFYEGLRPELKQHTKPK
jgi:hypothetical protein